MNHYAYFWRQGLYGLLISGFVWGLSADDLISTSIEVESSSMTELQAEKFNACMIKAVPLAKNKQTIGELRKKCRNTSVGLVQNRRDFERAIANNPFAILPYRPNYVLPFTYSKANEGPYSNLLQGRNFENVEAKFQVSFKYIAATNVLLKDLDLQVAFTSTSWWQSYNKEISAPFRETNYEPELILNFNREWSLFGLPVKSSFLSFNHQSNGQGGDLSRSWNRIIGGIVIDHGDFVWTLSGWWRIPEDKKADPLDVEGDDNPDIAKYLGYGEWGAVWKLPHNHNLEMRLRNNLRKNNKGSVELGWSFPLTKRLRGYFQYFNGYGDGLIYYNESVERFGVGVKITDWL